METNRLVHFRAIVDSGGLTKASELLGITAGGLSKSIKVLEEDIGFKLFIQKGRGLELTDLGKEFYDKVPSALKVIGDLVDVQTHKVDPLSRPIKFCSFEVFTTYFLANFFNENFSEQIVEVREAIPGEMERLISDGSSDIGITYEPIPYRGVEFLKCGKIRMGIFGALSKWKNKNSISELPFITPINPLEGTPSGVKGLDGWPEHLFERKVQFRVDMMETAVQLASLGRGVVYIPIFIAKYFNAQASDKRILEEIKTDEIKPIYRDVFIVQRKNKDEDALVKKIARTIRQLK